VEHVGMKFRHALEIAAPPSGVLTTAGQPFLHRRQIGHSGVDRSTPNIWSRPCGKKTSCSSRGHGTGASCSGSCIAVQSHWMTSIATYDRNRSISSTCSSRANAGPGPLARSRSQGPQAGMIVRVVPEFTDRGDVMSRRSRRRRDYRGHSRNAVSGIACRNPREHPEPEISTVQLHLGKGCPRHRHPPPQIARGRSSRSGKTDPAPNC